MFSSAKNQKAFLAAAILLLAASLRLYHLGQRSLWFDEAVAADISHHSIAETVALTRGMHSAPLTHPILLSFVEKFSARPIAVRAPSMIFSLLAVALMLCFAGLPSIDDKAAMLAALMLCVSVSQIRYAQEVREYSLSVLYAGILIYAFLALVAKSGERKLPLALCLALFGAPLIQYGLVLFGFSILFALLIVGVADRRIKATITTVLLGGLSLSAGGIVAYFSTLRYQWGQKPWYLEDAYWSRGTSFLHFVWMNSHRLLTFLLPGKSIVLLAALAIIVAMAQALLRRAFPPLLVLACTAFGTVLACAVLHVYPYDSVRQCLFLAPIACLCAASSIVESLKKSPATLETIAFGGIVCLIVVSGAFQIRTIVPYKEVEDTQSVLASLKDHIEPSDWVYVYCGAVPAVDFYLGQRPHLRLGRIPS